MPKNILILLFLNIPFLFAQNYGSWIDTDSLNTARTGHAMVVLQNGNILVSGHASYDTTQNRSCEIYDISSNTWRFTAPFIMSQYGHDMVTLYSGEVLKFGGGFGKSCEIFNPISEEWRMTDSIPTDRLFGGEEFVTLKDGRIFVMGGVHWSRDSLPSVTLNNCEIYDLVTEKWTMAEPMLSARSGFAATLLDDGNILVSGGDDKAKNYKYCEIYLTETNTWVETDSLVQARAAHAQIMLDDGNVLLVGGVSRDSLGNTTSENRCLLYNVQKKQWQSVGKLAAYRNSPGVFKISEKYLIIVGGDLNDTWEIYDLEKFESVYYENFITQHIINGGNTIQLKNRNILINGGEESGDLSGLPVIGPSKRCSIFDVVTDVKKIENKIYNYVLNQNYPNPFNPSTTINYQIPKDGFVSLVVYNTLGQVVAELVNQHQTVGKYSINFNASNLPSGVYFYRIESGNFVQVNKMLLLR